MSIHNETSNARKVCGKQSGWDVSTILEQVWSDLNGTVSRVQIQKTLMEIIPRYESARILTFVPIFIRRDTVERLKTTQIPDLPPDKRSRAARRQHGNRENAGTLASRIDERSRTTEMNQDLLETAR